MGTGRRRRVYNFIAASVTALNGEPSAITAGVDCSDWERVSVVGAVTANATDTSDFKLWRGYITSAPTTQPITVEWILATDFGASNKITATEGANGDTISDTVPVEGAARVYVEWDARTDADTRATVNVYLHNSANPAG
jgi:hypothetical protein